VEDASERFTTKTASSRIPHEDFILRIVQPVWATVRANS
jgi:hypothetical protein